MKVFDVCLLVPAILFLLLLIYTSPRSRQKLSGAPAFVVFLQFITLASTGTHLPSVYHPCVYRYSSSFSLSPLRLQVLIFLQFITLASTGTYLPSVHHPCVYRYLSSFSSSPLRLEVLIFLQFMTLASTGIRLPSVYHFCPLFSQASLNIKGQLKIKIIIF